MTPDHERFETSGGELAYLDTGAGPAVVLIHGFGTSSHLWREFLPLLAGRFHVIAPDLLGSGDSAHPADAPLHIRAQANYVRELLDHLGIERYAAVGHGSGGGVAQLLALDDARTDALVLLDSVAFDMWPSGRTLETVAELAERSNGSAVAIVESAIRSEFEVGMLHRDRFPDAALDEYQRPYRGPGGVERFARAIGALDGLGLTGRDEDFERIAFPVLILWGEDDPFMPVSLAERLNEAMPSSTLGLLPGCGHYLPEEAPETIGPMIAEYLRARFLMEPHGHREKEGVVMLQLERRPPWVDLAHDEEDDWYVVEAEQED